MLTPVNEKQFMAQVIRLARLYRWLWYHTHDSRRSCAGFPDLVLTKQRRLLFVELKTEKGRVTADQAGWLSALQGAGQDVRLWRPSSWPEIQATLTGEG